MTYRVLDTVVLTRDVPEHDLREGDLGAVVEVYARDAVEVEFVSASDNTRALLTLSSADVRPVMETDVIAVRRLNKSA